MIGSSWREQRAITRPTVDGGAGVRINVMNRVKRSSVAAPQSDCRGPQIEQLNSGLLLLRSEALSS